MSDVFEIATENGGVFCKCSNTAGTPVLIGKEGKISLQTLMDQVYHPEIAQQMRRRKLRSRQKRDKTEVQ